MRWLKLVLVGVLVLGSHSFVGGAQAFAAGTAYSFALLNTTAVAPAGGMMAAPGDRISVRGAGTFDPATRRVQAGGTFTHSTATGAVMCQGTWQATEFASFLAFGTAAAGAAGGPAGGVLSLVVRHDCTTRDMAMTGIPMTVTSTLQAPAGSSYVEGITVGDFTQPTGGTVLMARW